MTPLRVVPVLNPGDQPFYVKLRPQGDRQLLTTGSGRLSLEFRVDRIYHVHWNNLNAPIQVELEAPGETVVTPNLLKGPKVDASSDVDPGEFLIDVENWNPVSPLRLQVHYVCRSTTSPATPRRTGVSRLRSSMPFTAVKTLRMDIMLSRWPTRVSGRAFAAWRATASPTPHMCRWRGIGHEHQVASRTRPAFSETVCRAVRRYVLLNRPACHDCGVAADYRGPAEWFHR